MFSVNGHLGKNITITIIAFVCKTVYFYANSSRRKWSAYKPILSDEVGDSEPNDAYEEGDC